MRLLRRRLLRRPWPSLRWYRPLPRTWRRHLHPDHAPLQPNHAPPLLSTRRCCRHLRGSYLSRWGSQQNKIGERYARTSSKPTRRLTDLGKLSGVVCIYTYISKTVAQFIKYFWWNRDVMTCLVNLRNRVKNRLFLCILALVHCISVGARPELRAKYESTHLFKISIWIKFESTFSVKSFESRAESG